MLKRRLIVSESLLTEGIRLRVSLEKRLTLILSGSLRLVAIEVSGISVACHLGDSEREPTLGLSVVRVRR